MFYTIYKITNKINGKYYIGMHKTSDLDDNYMGSGKLIQKAIEKYGIENFSKEILYVFDNEKDMRDKEKELVIISEETYNLCEGGQGGFSYINNNPDKFLTEKRLKSLMPVSEMMLHWRQKYKQDSTFREACAERARYALQKSREANPKGAFYGKSHTEEYKQKMSLIMKEKQGGVKNSQYGTCWITNGQENKKIKKEDLDNWLELGYNKGRVCK